MGPLSGRVKTDERDAQRLLRLLMIDALHAVRVPSPEERRCVTSSARAKTSAVT
jgi:transposase